MSNLRSALVRLAHANPELRGDLLPLLAPASGLPRVAVTDDTYEFTMWAIMKNDRIGPAEAEKILERMGVPMKAPKEKTKKTEPLKKGDHVDVKARKNTNALNVDACEKFDGQDGFVTEVGSNFVVVDFRGPRGGLGRFEGANITGAKTGLFRYTSPDVAESKKMVEMIYISEKTPKPPSKDRIEMVKKYVEKGLAKGEQRSEQYYTGRALAMTHNKQGQFYFSVFSQQRDSYPRSINPTKGQLLYLGQLNKRPGGWRNEYAALMAKAGEGEE